MIKQQRRALGVPAHPLLVHFPIAFWLAAPLFDLGALFVGEPWITMALGATVAGVVIGAAAVVTGLLEYMQPSLAGIDMRLAARHGTRTALAWSIFAFRAAAAAFWLPDARWSMIACLVLDIVGSAILIQGVYFGTRQVYEQLEKN